MASVLFGGGVVQISGSIGGSTFARNRSGNYIRPRTKPINPNSDAQAKVRSCIAYLTEYWADFLSVQNRADWGTYATNVPMKNVLGQTIHLSGFNHFIRSNAGRLYHDWNILHEGPTDFTLPAHDPTLTIDVDSAPQIIAVHFNVASAWNKETGGCLMILQGIPQNGQRNFFAGPYRKLGLLAGSSILPLSSPQNITPVFPVALGQRQWCQFRIGMADGRLSEPWTVSAIVHSAAPGEGESKSKVTSAKNKNKSKVTPAEDKGGNEAKAA